VLAADVEQELAQRGRQRPAAAAVGAGPQAERGEAAGAVGVEPALQRRHAEALRRLAPRRAVRVAGQFAQGGGQLAAVEVAAAGERADDLGTDQGDLLGVVAWS
jgi:hypothetical protein